MTKHLVLLALVGLTMVSRIGNGYELATHSRITERAYQQSILSNPDTLRNLGIAAGLQSAPNWAMGSTDIFTQPNTAQVGRRNHFSILDAREAMYWMTLKSRAS